MPRIPPETIEQIQSANDIVEVIQGYIPLKRAAGVWKALCPFHQERTPSFSVNPTRQIFKCFGCGAGGNVIRFVMTYESLEFIEAARKLAERVGIRIVEGEMSAADSERYNMRRRLLALHAAAADFFANYLLKRPSAQIARDYLKGRGINADVAKSWKLGFAPDSFEAFATFAHQQGFTDQELVQSGLVKLRDEDRPNGDFYDRFRGRVMFPICNDTGEVIAFSGRVLQADAKGAKYINSPETMLFTKGAVLFGLHRSKRALINKGSAIVCEGQLDLITAFEAGVENVIAPQGTAFTEKQAHILKRYVEEVVLCFDADAAGEKAVERSLVSLLAENLIVRVAEIPPGEDPDSLIRGQGAAAFIDRIAAAKDFFDFQIDHVSSGQDFNTPRGKLHAARKIAESVSLLSDPILRETIINKATQRLEVSPKEFARMLKTQKTGRLGQEKGPVAEPMDPTLRLLALVALNDSDSRAWIFEEHWNEVLAREPDAGLLVKILEADIDPVKPGSIIAFLASLDVEEESTVSGLLETKVPENALKIAHDCWRDLDRRQTRRRIEAIQARLGNAGLTNEEVLNLQKQILDLQNRLSDIARPFSPPT